MNASPPELWAQWGLRLTEKGQPYINLQNGALILESDPKFKDCVYYDEFLQRVLRRNSPQREWRDEDDLEVLEHIQSVLSIPRMSRDAVSQAVIAVAHRHAKNCVRDWLEQLEHDGVARVDQFFIDCFGAEDSDYTRSASRNFWLSMPARVYRPGCKVDNMVVLEGPQGVGKSTALQLIAGDWFAEQHESAMNPKAFAEILQGKLLIEISEMDSFSRAEVNRVKQTISCPSDRFRASYGRHATDHPRQCVFVGTTNRDDWNRDETGARRFWPIACNGPVRTDIVAQNRDQLFAEAVARHKAQEPHWLMPEADTRSEQAHRYQADPWLSSVIQIVKGETEVTTAQVAEKIGIPIERRDRATEMRVASCLRFLGWERRQKRVGRDVTTTSSDNRAYVYSKPENQ